MLTRTSSDNKLLYDSINDSSLLSKTSWRYNRSMSNIACLTKGIRYIRNFDLKLSLQAELLMFSFLCTCMRSIELNAVGLCTYLDGSLCSKWLRLGDTELGKLIMDGCNVESTELTLYSFKSHLDMPNTT